MRYLLPAILLLGTQIASAQSILQDKDDKELSVLLNEVVITGTGTEHYLQDAPVQTEVITSKALEQYQARSIDAVSYTHLYQAKYWDSHHEGPMVWPHGSSLPLYFSES